MRNMGQAKEHLASVHFIFEKKVEAEKKLKAQKRRELLRSCLILTAVFSPLLIALGLLWMQQRG